MGSFPQAGVKIKNIWNHHPDYEWLVNSDPYFMAYYSPKYFLRGRMSLHNNRLGAHFVPFLELSSFK